MDWRAYWKTGLAAAGAGVLAVYAAILVFDPYGVVWPAPLIDGPPTAIDQRLIYPAIARKARFDSVVVGSSTTRLLRPDRLGAAFGGRFANLSRRGARPEEQMRLLALFARHHTAPGTVIVGLDDLWCRTPEELDGAGDADEDGWLYDEDRLNDFTHLFSLEALKDVGRRLRWLAGLHEPTYGEDGFDGYVWPAEAREPESLRRRLYPDGPPRRRAAVVPPVTPPAQVRDSWVFPAHDPLAAVLGSLPAETRKVLFFPPYHHFRLPAEGSLGAARLDECKARIARLAAGIADTHVLDFMFASRIALVDENYDDGMHFREQVADELVGLIELGLRERRGVPGLFRRLVPEATP